MSASASASGNTLASYIYTQSSTALAFGTNDFTIEFWMYCSNTWASPSILGNISNGIMASGNWLLFLNPNSQITFIIANSPTTLLVGGTSLIANNWYHIAITRFSASLFLFVNGLQDATATLPVVIAIDSTSTGATYFLTIGASGKAVENNASGATFLGYIDEVRVTNNLARYTAGFTVPGTAIIPSGSANANITQVLAADPLYCYVTLLLHFDTATSFTDSSILSNSVTQGSVPTISTVKKVYGTAAALFLYTQGSGVSNYISYPGASANFGIADFTIEFWVYITSYTTNTATPSYIISASSGNGIAVYITSTGLLGISVNGLYLAGNTSSLVLSSTTISLNTWTYISINRNGTQLVVYAGLAAGNTTAYITTTISSYCSLGSATIPLLIGSTFTGYIDELRITSGICRYYTTYAVPTAAFPPVNSTLLTSTLATPDPYYANVALLMHCNNYQDTSLNNVTLIATGTVTIASLISKYGIGSLFIGGGINTNYLSTPTSNAYSIGTQNFTIEFWVYFNGLPSTSGNGIMGIISNISSTNASAAAGISANGWGVYTQYTGSGYTLNFLGGITTAGNLGLGSYVLMTTPLINYGGLWLHVAIVRNGTLFTMYLNGNTAATATCLPTLAVDGNAATRGVATQINIGLYSTTANILSGYLDEIRVTIGIARYTGTTFPLPNVPFAPLYILTPPSYQPQLTFFSNASTEGDPYFNNVVLLLHGDGNFADSSQNNFTMAVIGSPTINTSIKQYGSGSFYSPANYTNYIYTTPTSYAFTFGMNPFTIEFWCLLPGNNNSKIMGSTNGSYWWQIYADTNNLYFYPIVSALNASIGGNFTTRITTGAWFHYAVCRVGNTITTYINGIVLATGSFAYSLEQTPGAYSLYVGWNGITGDSSDNGTCYLDEIRITNGVARYTANFTPPTAAFPNQTNLTPPFDLYYNNVILLMHCDGVNGSPLFIDNSPLAAALVLTNSTGTAPQISTAQYKFGSSSMLCNSSSNIVIRQSALSTVYCLGAGTAFTLEFWIYFIGFSFARIFAGATASTLTTSAFSSWVIYYDTTSSVNRLSVSFGGGSGSLVSTTNVFSTGTWYHIAYTYDGISNYNLYINGILNASLVSTTNVFDATPTVPKTIVVGGDGYPPDSAGLNGYLDEIRITKGIVRYTSNFSVPTTAFYTPVSTTATLPQNQGDPYYNNVVLLMHLDGTYADSSSKNTAITSGGTLITTNSKFGVGSISFANSSFTTPSSSNFVFSNNNFTVEFWIYITTAPTGSWGLMGNNTANGNAAGWGIYFNAATNVVINMFAVNLPNIPSWNASWLNTWTHFALVRNTTTVIFYVNGIALATNTVSMSPIDTGTTNTLSFGNWPAAAITGFTGYMDEIRVTNGVARYTANFVPQNAPFPNSATATAQATTQTTTLAVVPYQSANPTLQASYDFSNSASYPGSGTALTDLSANSRALTFTSSPYTLFSSTTVAGKPFAIISPTNRAVSSVSNVIDMVSYGYTLECLFNVAGTAGNPVLMCYDSAANIGIELRVSSANQLFLWLNNQIAYTLATISLNTWYHAIVSVPPPPVVTIGNEYPPTPLSAAVSVLSGNSYGNGTYTIAASTANASYSAYTVFDKNNTTYWTSIPSSVTNTSVYNNTASPYAFNTTTYSTSTYLSTLNTGAALYGEYIDITLPQPIIVSSYSISSPGSVTSYVKTNLVGYWDFANSASYPGSGNTITDLSGNGYTMTLNGSQGTYNSSTPKYLPFTQNTTAYTSTIALTPNTTGITFEYFISNVTLIYGLFVIGYNVYQAGWSNTVLSIQESNTSIIPGISNTYSNTYAQTTANQLLWHHVIVTISSGTNPTLTLYLNGSLVGSSVSTSTIVNASQAIILGGSVVSSNNGCVCNFGMARVYSTALTAAQANQNYLSVVLPQMMPSAWQLIGWNAINNTWTSIATQSTYAPFVLTTTQTQTFNITGNSTPYFRYRLVITAISGNSSTVAIGEIRLYSTSTINTEILQNPITYLSFDGHYADISGNNLATSVTGSISYATGLNGSQCLSTNSNSSSPWNNFVTVPNTQSLPITVSFWVYTNSATYQTCIGLSGATRSGGGIQFDLPSPGTSSITASCALPTQWTAVAGSTIIALNTWYHITLTVSSTYVGNIYINGLLSGTGGPGSGTFPSYTNFYVGTAGDASRGFSGYIDDFRVYNTVLSATDIYTIYSTYLGKTNMIQTWPPYAMTGNTTTLSGKPYGNGTYIVTYSSVYSGLNAYSAFDKIFTTSGTGWESSGGYTSSTAVPGLYTAGTYTTTVKTNNVSGASSVSVAGEWLQIQLPQPIIMTSYSLTPRETANIGQSPYQWVIVGSNDGSTWILLDSQYGNISWVQYISQTFTISGNAIPYVYYRIIVQAIWGNGTGGSYTDINEWVLYGNQTAIVQWPPAPLTTNTTTTLSSLPYGNGPYVVTSSSYYSVGPLYPYLVFDKLTGENANAWLSSGTVYTNSAYNATTYSTLVSGNLIYGEWVDILLPTQIVLNYYTIQAETTSYTRTPRTWIIAGSNNGGITWFQVDSQTNVTYSYVSQVIQFIINNNTIPYNEYRIIIKNINTLSGNDWTAIAEWVLYGSQYTPINTSLYLNGALSSSGLLQYTPSNAQRTVCLGDYGATSATQPGNFGQIFQWPPAPLTASTTLFSTLVYGNGSYVVTSTSTNGSAGYNPYNGFDKTISGIWAGSAVGINYSTSTPYTFTGGTGATYTTTVGATPYYGEWLDILLPQSIILTSYSIAARGDANYAQTPSQWYIVGSNNAGSTWAIVDTQTGINYTSASQIQTFTITGNNTAYNEYRIVIIALSPGNNGYTSISEWILYGQQASVQQWPPAALTTNTITSLSNLSYGNGLYTATASSYFTINNLYPYFAFNKTGEGTNNIWAISTTPYNISTGAYTLSTYSTTVAGTAILGEWLDILLPNQIVLTSYSIQARSSTSYVQTPYTWTIAGTNNGGVTWYQVDSKTSQAYTSANQIINFTPTGTYCNIPFNEYRIIIQYVQPSNGNGSASIAEWILFGTQNLSNNLGLMRIYNKQLSVSESIQNYASIVGSTNPYGFTASIRDISGVMPMVPIYIYGSGITAVATSAAYAPGLLPPDGSVIYINNTTLGSYISNNNIAYMFDPISIGFTWETWVNFSTFANASSSINSGMYLSLFSIGGNATATTVVQSFGIGVTIAGNVAVRWHGTTVSSITSQKVLSINTWYHIAITCDGTTLRIYINGYIDTFTTQLYRPLTYNDSAYMTIGQIGNLYTTQAYISNMRLIKGTALYTANTFPIANTPLSMYPANMTSGTCVMLLRAI